MSIAIVDSRAGASIVSKKTLETALHQPRPARLEDAKIIQNEHRFWTATTAYKTIAAVGAPFIFDSPDETICVEFHLRFDVIEGDLPF